MNTKSPPSLLDLAKMSLLQDKTLAIDSLKSLPRELFPPVFMAAVAGRHSHILREMVQAWPFHRLSLGPLMVKVQVQQPYHDILKAALDGLDGLLSQKVQPKGWKLKVLDLRRNVQTNFWDIWSGTKALTSLWSLEEPETSHSRSKKHKGGDSRTNEKHPVAPVEVITDLFLKEDSPDELFTFLFNRVKQKKSLPRLRCRTLDVVGIAFENVEEVLKAMRLDYIQEIEVDCPWDLPTLARFALHLGQMVNLNKIHISHIQTTPCLSPETEDTLIATVTSQFFGLHRLRELYLDSVLFLEGCLDQLLRCLKIPLDTLWIMNCVLSVFDLAYLSVCPITNHLRKLCLSGVKLASISPECLQVILEKTSATLRLLDLSECGLTDSQVTVILPALSHCSQLRILCCCGNLVSMAVLESLLRNTIPLRNFVWGLFPVPLECYLGTVSPHNLRNVREYLENLRLIVQELGRRSSVSFSTTCAQCGTTKYYVA
ncbi:PREDICTED: melanoma antigen preferentially expressed in tumors-like [Elephantulus edwardii]|uniref:melanoma antigen preferentially expressed in tumors-like n=1 Tax=Elephantulus edwardii TaxID=28737 RepID=UPI0003F0A047|nr:PREDICTED: melanoma antigen preferentially expressed in tumors-like [Elephantulus edwardii]